jgi:tetratricopeptide (TPR) repeat protein
MRRSLPLALALSAACATAPQRPPSAQGGDEQVAIHRALVAIEAAARRGEIAAQRQRWSAEAAARPDDPAPAFLAASALPPDEEARARMKAISLEHPRSALGQVGLARIYLFRGTTDQVDRATAAALALEPEGWLALLPRAAAAEARGRAGAAAADWRRVLEADPANPEAHAGLARLARASGDAASARSHAEAALAAAPGYVPALAVVAGLARDAGDTAGAARAWGEAAAAGPRDRELRVAYAKALADVGDRTGAVRQWTAAADLGESAEVLLGLAAAGRAAGDAPTEASALERLGRVAPTGARWLRLGELRAGAGDLAGAEEAYRRALALEPESAGAQLGLGRVLVRRGATQQALGPLRAAGPSGEADRSALEARLNVRPVSARDVATLQRAVGDLVERTYRARRAGAPQLAGDLELRVTVGRSGTATLVEVRSDTVEDEDVRASAYWNLRDAHYPPKEGRYAFRFALRPAR